MCLSPFEYADTEMSGSIQRWAGCPVADKHDGRSTFGAHRHRRQNPTVSRAHGSDRRGGHAGASKLLGLPTRTSSCCPCPSTAEGFRCQSARGARADKPVRLNVSWTMFKVRKRQWQRRIAQAGAHVPWDGCHECGQHGLLRRLVVTVSGVHMQLPQARQGLERPPSGVGRPCPELGAVVLADARSKARSSLAGVEHDRARNPHRFECSRHLGRVGPNPSQGQFRPSVQQVGHRGGCDRRCYRTIRFIGVGRSRDEVNTWPVGGGSSPPPDGLDRRQPD